MSLFISDFQFGNELIASKQCKQAINSFLKHIDKHPEDAAKCYERIAECYLRISRKNTEIAEEYYRKAIKINPKLFKAVFGLTEILPECSDERLNLMEIAINIQANFVLLLKLGDFYRSCKKDYTKAYNFYEKAWQIYPKDRSSYQKIWTLCAMTKDKETSAKWSRLYKEYCK